jgi:hypothetical protein
MPSIFTNLFDLGLPVYLHLGVDIPKGGVTLPSAFISPHISSWVVDHQQILPAIFFEKCFIAALYT